MGALDYYLCRKRQALADRQADWTEAPDKSIITVQASSRLAGNTGTRPTQMGTQHQILSDSAPGLAGHALGPTAPEMLLGALASCLVHTYVIEACLQNIALDGVEIQIEAQLPMAPVVGLPGAASRFQDIRYKALVNSPAADDTIERLHQAVEQSCPVLNTLRAPVRVERIDR